jgi:hypothetical protein
VTATRRTTATRSEPSPASGVRRRLRRCSVQRGSRQERHGAAFGASHTKQPNYTRHADAGARGCTGFCNPSFAGSPCISRGACQPRANVGEPDRFPIPRAAGGQGVPAHTAEALTLQDFCPSLRENRAPGSKKCTPALTRAIRSQVLIRAPGSRNPTPRCVPAPARRRVPPLPPLGWCLSCE